jgi:hypothetical protein
MRKFVNVVQEMAAMMENYAEVVFTHLTSSCLTIFTSLWGIWLIYMITKAALKGGVTVAEFLKPGLIGIVVTSMLTFSHFKGWIYEPFMETFTNLAQLIITAISDQFPNKAGNMYDVLRSVFEVLGKLLNVMNDMIRDSSPWHGLSLNAFASLFMSLSFLFLYMMILMYNVDFMFKCMVLSAVSPILIVMAAFQPSRPMAVSALKIALHSAFTMVFSVLGVGAAIFILKKTVGTLPAATAGQFGEFAFTQEYWVCLLAVCFSIFLQLKVPVLAGFVGASDGPGSAAAVSGAFVSMVGLAYNKLKGKPDDPKSEPGKGSVSSSPFNPPSSSNPGSGSASSGAPSNNPELIKTYFIVLASTLSACASKEEGTFTGSGSDQLPASACQTCDKEPFYKAGKWQTR